MNLRRIAFALVASLSLAISATGAVFADSSVPETLSIPNILQMTGVPASLTYAPDAADYAVQSAPAFDVAISATGVATLRVVASNFVGSAQTYDAAVRNISADGTTINLGDNLVAGTAYDVSAFDALGGSRSLNITSSLMLPNLVAGSYAGTQVWSIS